MVCHVYSNNHRHPRYFMSTHKNNPNVRQIITLARSGLFMEYCCLVLGVYVSGGQKRGGGVYFKLIFIKTEHREAAWGPYVLLDYFALLRLLILLRSNWGCCRSVLEKSMRHRYYLKRYCEFSGYQRGALGIFLKEFSCQVPNGSLRSAGQGAKCNGKCVDLIIRKPDSGPCPATNDQLIRRTWQFIFLNLSASHPENKWLRCNDLWNLVHL